jgi:arsenite methyltransferase
MMPEPYSSPAMRTATGETARPGGLSLTRRALDFCAFAPGARVLDVGCGSGATVRLMIEEHGLDASGMDLSPAMISLGVSACPSLPLGPGNAMAPPHGSEELDGAIMECALSITADPGKVLQEIHRILKPGGRLILTDMYLLDGSTGLGWSEAAAAVLCLKNVASRPAIERMLTTAGFRVLLWEDHLPHLKQLGAEIIMKFGSLSRFLAEASGDAGPGERQTVEAATAPGSFRGISYYLAVAQKA